MRSIDDLLGELSALGISLTCVGTDLRVRGQVGSISQALRQELAERKQALIAHLRMALPALAKSPAPRSTAPLSFNQRRLWFLDRLEGGGSAFVLIAGWQLSGPLDRAALDQAMSAVVARHELLRSVIDENSEEDDGSALSILAPAPIHIPLETAAADTDAQTILAQEANTPFDLAAAPPFRIRLVRLAPERHLLVLAIHHIASDRWSMGLLIKEVGILYSAAANQVEATLDPLEIQYSDYAVWQRAAFGEAQLAPHLQFWREHLADAVTELALPLDRPRPAERGDAAALHRFRLPAQHLQQIQAYALRCGATPFMVLLAAYALVLSRWSGQDELVIGCPLGNRERVETHGLIGFFVNSMPLRIDLGGDPCLDLIVQRVRATCLAAFAHQDAPFEHIVQAVKPERTLNKAPLFQTMFVLQTADAQSLQMAHLDAQPLSIQPGAPELDLNFSIEADGAGYACLMEYDADLFGAETVAEFCRQFSYVVQTGWSLPSQPMSCLPLMPAPTVAAPAGPLAGPADSPLSLIAAAARAFPDHAAIESGARSMCYRELMAQVHGLALRITAAAASACVVPDAVIGLCLPRSPELVVAMLAVWQAGAGYAVLSPSQPKARRAQLIESGNIPLIITMAEYASECPAPVLLLDARNMSLADAPAAIAWPAPAALAYVCFTSGSSGAPKGVAVSHGNLGNHARAVIHDFGLASSDRVMQFAAADFDVAAEEIFPTLAAGACLVLRPEGSTDSIEAFNASVAQAGLTVLNLPAAFWHEWVRTLDEERSAPPGCVRLVITGSDRVFVRRLRQWQNLCRHPIAFRSGYGPTEATITTAFFDPARHAIPESAEILPLGSAIANVRVDVVDGAGCPVPSGVIGEIMISGAGVARGYVGMPHLTEAAFRAHPAVPGARAYWSGDLARVRADGALEFIGRKDSQAKVRGFRIEPAEIEAALMSHPRVREASVVVRADRSGLAQLLAVVAGEVDAPMLRAWLAERLQAHMVPAVWAIVPALPRASSGKIDLRALKALDVAQDAVHRHDAAGAAPASAVEAALAKLFAEALELSTVDIGDNFFDLGIDSIRSLQIVSRARQVGLGLTVRDIFKFQSIRQLTQALAEKQALPQTGHDAGGDIPPTPIQAWFFEQVTDGLEHYNQSAVLRVPQAIDPRTLERALDGLAKHHELLRLRVDQGRLSIAADPPAPLLTVLDLAGIAPGEQAQRRDQAFAEAQRSMGLAQGRVLRAVLVLPAARLLVSVHHLAIDAYSWSILLDDLATAYDLAARGEPICLPAPTSSYRSWSKRLAALAASREAGDHARFFMRHFGHRGQTLLRPALEPGTVGGAAHAGFTLSKEATSVLLQTTPKAFGARMDEILLAALATGAGRLGVAEPMHFDLERNGRADLFDDLDLSRTVGWFTAVQPVAVSQFTQTAPAGLLAQIASEVAASPYRGLGMGLLRYLSPDPAIRTALSSLPGAEILVNYLGRMDLGMAEDEAFAVTDDDAGPAQSPAIARSHVIEVNAGIWNGSLKAEISFPGAAGEQPRMARWAEETVRALGEIAAASIEAADAGSAADVIEEELPLTPLQQGILFHSLRDPDIYFDQLCLTLEGPLDVAAWRSAWVQALGRHSMLRTSFHWQDVPAMVQRAHRAVTLPWQFDDWRGMDADARPAALKALLQQDRARGFDLTRAPLMRLHLVRLDTLRHELVWSAHHLLLDGWSVSVLMEEVFALYRQILGDASVRLKAAPRFGEYVGWHGRRDRQADAEFWRGALQGLEEPTSIAFATLARDPLSPDDSGIVESALSSAQTQGMLALAQRARTTPGTVLQAAWSLLLARCSASRDVLFGVTVSGRPAELSEIEGMVGMLIATVPARVRIPSTLGLLDWLRALQEQHLAREQHAAMPLTEIKQASALAAGADLFQTLVLIQNYPAANALSAGGLCLAGVAAHEKTNYPLTLVCKQGAQLEVGLCHDVTRIGSVAARRLLDQFVGLLDAMAQATDRPVTEFLPLARRDAQQALDAGRGPLQPIAPAFLHDTVDAWARQTPDAIALADQDASLSYAELSRQSQRVAHTLRAGGVGSETLVALCLPRSIRYVVTILAILRCGAAFVPIDPAYPVARKRFILEDCGAALLITEQDGAANLSPANLRTVLLDALFATAPDATAVPDLPCCQADAVAYVIYTSGTTGMPKGVANTHAGLRSLTHAQRSIFKLAGSERVLQFASLSFDASVWEISMALGAGAALLVPIEGSARPGPDLMHFIERHQVTAATLPPTALATLDSDRLPMLRLLVVAGEACAPELARRWAVGRRFYNAYGPSEASVAASIEEGAGESDLLPIGYALPNVQLHVLDAAMHPVPPGVIGELYIGGTGLARGYLNRPRLTAASFLPDPYGAPGARLYKTGDRGYRLSDGRVQFVGRVDHQVKLRGFRIELSEIEAALAQHPAIKNAAVIVRQHGEADQRLAAFFEVRSPVASDALRAYLRTRLPDYMVPAYFIELPVLPLTSSGKIDRKALALERPDTPQAPGSSDTRALSAAEAHLGRIWAQVLGVEQVHPDQNFFELGGDSILAIQVVSKANQQGIEITLNQIMDPATQTVASLAAVAESIAGAPEEDFPLSTGPVPLTPIQHWFLDQAAPDPHHYNQSFLLEVPLDLDAARLALALNALQMRHDALRLRFRRTATGWIQTLIDPEPLDVSVVQPPEAGTDMSWRAMLEAAAARCQAGLQIESGPLIRLVLFQAPAGMSAARLLIVVHHLAIDAVSWRILLDDLFNGYAQAPAIRLPRAGTPFSQWSGAVSEYAASDAARSELPFWLAPRPDLAQLPLLHAAVASTVADAHMLSRSLDQAATTALIRELPRTYGAQVQEVLLAALTTTLAGLIAGDQMMIAIESHGRDIALGGMDVGGTLGWFTVLAPVALPLCRAGTAGAAIGHMRSALQSMPRHGFSFGALRFLSPDPAIRDALASLPSPDIIFNYLGQWDTAWPSSIPIRPALESDGSGFAPTTPRPYALEVNALIAAGRLQVDLSFDPRLLERAFVDRLADGILAWLEQLTGPARPIPVEGEAKAEAAAAHFPLSPQQAAMLDHALTCPGSEAYVVQFSASLPRDLDIDLFIASWAQVLARHVALRACFSATADGAPRQHFSRDCRARWLRDDWSALPPSENDAAFHALCETERQRGFTLDEAPLMRFSLLRTASAYRFLWTYHHLLVDGWSIPLVLSEVLAAYGRKTATPAATAAAAPDFTGFLAWLTQQDHEAGRRFWRAELEGLAASRWPAADGKPCSGRFAEKVLRLAPETGPRVSAFARKSRLSVPSVLLQAWAVVLAGRTGRQDICFGVTSALRPAEVVGIEAMVGSMISTHPLRHAIDLRASFTESCRLLQRRRVAASAHAYLSPDAIAECAGFATSADLFGTAVRIQNYPLGEMKDNTTALQLAEVAIKDYWHFPFNLEVTPGDDMVLIAVYDPALVDGVLADALLAGYALVLGTLDELPLERFIGND